MDVRIMSFMTKTLELHHILSQIALYAKTERVKTIIESLYPMTDLDEIELSLFKVLDMMNLISKIGNVPLIEDFDIAELIKYGKMNRNYTIHELLIWRLFLKMERDVIQYFKNAALQKIPLKSLEPLATEIKSHAFILSYMYEKMDDDGLILDQATSELYKIRKDKFRLDRQLQDKMQRLLNDYQNYLNEYVVVIRNDRFCLPVKDGFKSKIKGIIHDMSASKQTVYIEPEQARNITAQIETLNQLEKKEIDKILQAMSEKIHQEINSLALNLDVFITLDVLNAKALYALKINAYKPTINKIGTIKMIKARHPLIDQKEVVPIDLELNAENNTLLITGPNTGGKTVALKTMGLLTLMLQSGLLVPLSEQSELAIFDQVFADIGDEQSIMQSLSTFSSHMTKIVTMLDHIKDNTLVLLDELGSGTDPNEGVSLAIALLEAFRKHDLRMIVTTHYSELKSYAYEKDKISTASVAFDKKSLKPLYYLQKGTTGSSHAFLIAKRLGLNNEIIEHAKLLYQGRQTDLAKIMEKLNEETLNIQQQKEILNETIHKEKEVIRQYEEKTDAFLKERDQLLERIKTREEKKWNELKLEALKIIDDLKEKETLTKPEIANFKHDLRKGFEDDKETIEKDQIKVGDRVFILPYQQTGTVKQIKSDSYEVEFGKFELTFKAYDLKKEKLIPNNTKTKNKKESISIKTGSTPQKSGQTSLDLRGFRYEEVHDALDLAIDRAMLSNISTISVIHGFGSGAVRKAVYQYLKSTPYVKSYRFGEEGEGLNGVTILTLK
jgi:DNA mismatch repair protein MutS2